MSGIEKWFEKLVEEGKIPQTPMNYDTASYKIYVAHLEAENAALRERLEKAVELPCKERMSGIEKWFEKLVEEGKIPQTPMNYDTASYKIYVAHLEAENAALRERLEKAIELPYEVGSTVYSISETDEEDNFNPWIDAGRVVSFSIDVDLWIYVRYNSGLTMWYTKDSFDKEVCITFEAAEARLAELKGGKNE